MPVRFHIAVLGGALACLTAVAACTSPSTDGTGRPAAASSSRPDATSSGPTSPRSTSPATTPPAPTTSSSAKTRPPATHRPTPTPTRSRPSRSPSAAPRSTPTARPTSHAAALPLGYGTGSARQVITVDASAQADTTGTVQAWRRVPGGWRRVGASVPAFLGTDGMTPHPSEQVSATPMGSYTLTQAFGYDSNPGTGLRYTQTTPADWWISQAGPLYNTMQRCASNCSFTQGDPNEHLYTTRPYYAYAAVIDYNTRNAGPVRQGAGSAFFLHVANGAPTAGCVSIAEPQLVRILRWLDPAANPRILIGTN